jgi:hypothetical protein
MPALQFPAWSALSSGSAVDASPGVKRHPAVAGPPAEAQASQPDVVTVGSLVELALGIHLDLQLGTWVTSMAWPATYCR